MKNKKITFWIGVFAFYTILGLINTTAVITSDLAESNKVSEHVLFYEMTGAYSAFLVLPVMLFFIKKFPISKNNFLTHIPLHFVFAFFTGIIHTFVMWGSRDLIFRIMDWGIYNYGIMTYRFIMESAKLFLGYWVAYLVVLIFEYLNEIQERKIQNAKLKEELTSVRLQALQMQLNPHFLFNTLNMISSVMYQSVSKADKMITHLSDLLRKTLDSGNLTTETLSDEIKKIKIYIEIMKARFQDKLEVEYNFPEDEKELNFLVPPFILQPIVENSIKYSQEKLSEKVRISISAKIVNEIIRIEISDNGPGIDDTKLDSLNKGYGLNNTQERLEKLYASDFKFLLENKPEGGLKTIIEFPASLRNNL